MFLFFSLLLLPLRTGVSHCQHKVKKARRFLPLVFCAHDPPPAGTALTFAQLSLTTVPVPGPNYTLVAGPEQRHLSWVFACVLPAAQQRQGCGCAYRSLGSSPESGLSFACLQICTCMAGQGGASGAIMGLSVVSRGPADTLCSHLIEHAAG